MKESDQMTTKFITKDRDARLYLISDTHLIANELHDDGIAFQHMRDTSAGKDLDYQEIALTAFTRMLLKKKPTALIITGDLTFNGEKASAERLHKIFAPLLKAGIHLFTIPGNHDIFDGWARKFENDKELYAAQISPFDWKRIFSDGYQNSINTDPTSLSYSVNLNKKYHLVFLDTNIYGQHESNASPTTNGELSMQQLEWLAVDLAKARSNNQHSLLFMHHNLYDHNKIIHGGYTLDNAGDLHKLCNQYHVAAVFSGHIHAQNIIRGDSECLTPDIATSCFCMTDQGYGIIDISIDQLSYQRYSFTMSPYLTDNEKSQLPQKAFQKYLADIFDFTNRSQMSWLYREVTNPKEQKEIIDFIDQLNWNFFVGKSNYSSAQRQKLKAKTAYQLITQKLPEMKAYLDTLLAVNENSWKLKLDFKDK